MFQRHTVRLPYFDYAKSGLYYVTICTWQRECILGEIIDGKMHLNQLGHLVNDEWRRTPHIRPYVSLDAYVVMPNHIHAILQINDVRAYSHTPLPTPEPMPIHTPFRSPSRSVGAIVRGWKSATTKNINVLRQSVGNPVWQRNYYEHVVRDNNDLARIRDYIQNNPINWRTDAMNQLS